jgi:hypothetical protein
MSDKFEVEVKTDNWEKEKIALSMTHNGYQWMTFSSLTPDELRQIGEAISKYLGGLTLLAADAGERAAKA